MSSSADALTFLRSLYGDHAPGWLTIWTLPDRATGWYPAQALTDAAAYAHRLAPTHDVYVGLGLRAQQLPEGRGESTDVIGIPGLWIEVDLKHAVHKKVNLPETIDDACALVRKALPLQLSLIIDSGYGIQGHWLFREPWIFTDDADRLDAYHLLHQLQATVQSVAKMHQWDVDSTFDLARVLRVPGTYNRKVPDAPKPVTIIEAHPDQRYNPSDFTEHLIDVDETSSPQITIEESAGDLPRIDLHTIKIPTWLKTLIRHGEDVNADKPYPSRSEALFDAVQGLMKAGIDDHMSLSLLLDARNIVGEKARENGRKWTVQELARIRAKLNGHLKASVTQPQTSEPPTDDTPIMTLPSIDADNEDIPIIAGEAWEALLAANNPPVIFRQGTPIRLEHDPKTGLHAVEVNAHRWRHHLARAANFYQTDTKGTREPAIPPTWLVEDMLARPNPPLPPLTRIVEVPVFAPDGTLQIIPGYHPASATFLDPPNGLQIPEVPNCPTREDVTFARLFIEEIFVDFPFASTPPCDAQSSTNAPDQGYQANIAHSYALLLLPFIRDLIDDSTPIHLIEASTAGSGKGLLAHVLLGISLGHHIGVLTEAKEEDEWRKRLTTVFKEVRAAVLLDNLRRPLDSGQVAAALTAWSWEDRKLGTNETIRVPVRCVWCVTGNNPVLSTEIARRTIRIRLDPEMDRPWLRKGFKHPDLLAWVMANRGKLVWSALVLIQHWLAQGRPAPEKLTPLGSYEQWSNVIGGILETAGIPGFLSNLEEFYELADHEGAVLRDFVERWWEKYHSQEVGTAELLPIAQAIEGLELRGKDDGGMRRSLGRLLAKQRNQVIKTYRMCIAGTEHRATRWKLIDLSTRRGVM